MKIIYLHQLESGNHARGFVNTAQCIESEDDLIAGREWRKAFAK